MSETHTISMRAYVAVFCALLVLTAVTVAVAFVDLGALNDVVAMGIASTKATLVLIYFMHVRYSSTLTRLSIVSGIVFFAILVFLTMSDVYTREFLGAALW
jgi:cytochrome c oxidase subunit 4